MKTPWQKKTSALTTITGNSSKTKQKKSSNKKTWADIDGLRPSCMDCRISEQEPTQHEQQESS